MQKFIIQENEEEKDCFYYKIVKQPERYCRKYIIHTGTLVTTANFPGAYIDSSGLKIIYLQGVLRSMDNTPIRVSVQNRLQFLSALQEYCEYIGWEFELRGRDEFIGTL